MRKTPTAEKQAKELLRGAIDFHIHSGPDNVPRAMNDIQLAQKARESALAPLRFPPPPKVLVSAWQAVMRSKIVNRRGSVR